MKSKTKIINSIIILSLFLSGCTTTTSVTQNLLTLHDRIKILEEKIDRLEDSQAKPKNYQSNEHLLLKQNSVDINDDIIELCIKLLVKEKQRN